MDTMTINPAHISDFPNQIAFNKAMMILTVAGVPGTLIPDFLGQIYIDITNDNAYIATTTEASGFKLVTNA